VRLNNIFMLFILYCDLTILFLCAMHLSATDVLAEGFSYSTVLKSATIKRLAVCRSRNCVWGGKIRDHWARAVN